MKLEVRHEPTCESSRPAPVEQMGASSTVRVVAEKAEAAPFAALFQRRRLEISPTRLTIGRQPDKATIGDMPNDVLMNADREVQRAARRVTTSNDEDGFANAVERFILRT